MLDANYPVDRISAILSLSSASFQYSEADKGYLSFIKIPTSMMKGHDKEIVSRYLRVVDFSDYLVFYIRGNDKAPIIFENEGDAINTSQQQVKHLVKKLFYAIYRDTGIKFNQGFNKVSGYV